MRRPSSRPTVQDVAAAAGLSVASVSRAFGGGAALREATRQRVLEAARRLGYRVNANARGLKKGSNGALGVFCEGGSWMLYNDHYGQLLAGLADAAGADGVRLVFYFSEIEPALDQNPAHAKLRVRAEEALADGTVDGGILVGSGDLGDPKSLNLLRREGFPLVALGADRPRRGQVSVSAGVEERTRLALGLLLAQGHRRIAYVGLAKDSGHNLAAEIAFRAAARKRLLDFRPGDFLLPATYELMDPVELGQLLERGLRAGCTALLVANVGSATLVQDLLAAKGRRVPEDLSLLSFGYEPPNLRARPRHLSLVEGHLSEAGREAYRLYRALAEGKKPQSSCIRWTWTPNGQTLGPRRPR